MGIRDKPIAEESLLQQNLPTSEAMALLDHIVRERKQLGRHVDAKDARGMGRASPPIVLPQPNGSSMRFLFRWLTCVYQELRPC
jgi:hypothetical protein